jgi:Ni/Co efflux regulator RcnB
MKTILLTAAASAGLIAATSGVQAAETSQLRTTADLAAPYQTEANGRKGGGGIKPGRHFGGFKPGGHHIGFRPRPGFHGIPKHDIYRRPHRGFILPRYWVQPTFYLYNFRNYGLTAPSNGYYWSRYYDDAVLTDNRGYVQDYRSGIDWNAGYNAGPDRTDDYRTPEYGPAMRPDAGAYGLDEGEVAFAAPDGSSYSYDGEWQGEYIDPQGRVFEGDWSGTVTRHDGVKGPGYPAPKEVAPGAPYPEPRYEGGYDVPRGYEGYERCLKSNGVTGAAIGAILGGVAGNRIAGRGDRLGGTLLGAGLGGLAGVAIEKALDKCKGYRPGHAEPQHRPYPHPAPQGGYGYPHSWQGGYYYYPQAPQVTVTVVPGATHATTTVTEEIYYETVRAAPRKKVVRKWKAKPKPRCICR